MHVIFLHGPPAAGKYTIGLALSESSGVPLFHNHLAVDTAKSLFDFGTPGFNRMRAAIWRAAFTEAATTGKSFIFTFNPEATVDPALIEELRRIVETRGGRVHFVELACSEATVAARIGNESRWEFRKLTDANLYRQLQSAGAFEFPPLPAALLVIDTERTSVASAVEQIARVVALAEA